MIKLKTTLISVSSAIMFTFTAVGYAQTTGTLNLLGTATVEPTNDIFISLATATDENATVYSYVNTTLSSAVTLESATDSATITITVTNNSTHDKVFNRVTYIDDAYSNENIQYTLEGISTGTAVPNYTNEGKNSLTFTITFTFKNSSVYNPSLESVLLFEFANAADWETGDDEGGGGSAGGGGSSNVEIGEDFLALILAAISNKKGEYGLNDPQKGHVLENEVAENLILYSTDNLKGGHIKHFASTTLNTHKLDFMFEFISDTEYVLYMWRLKDVENPETVIGATYITVYKQVYHKINETWERSTTMAGEAIIKRVRNNDSVSVLAISPSEWRITETLSLE